MERIAVAGPGPEHRFVLKAVHNQHADAMSTVSMLNWFANVPNDPFYQPRKPLWLPEEMVSPPRLAGSAVSTEVERRFALLINPFYPKDPHASFGKHVLTPTLALTSVAAATPGHWRVRYWDENLLQGPPPADPMPEVVGITVHLTFSQRAYALARWFRARGAKVVLGGMHVLSCPEEAAAHADTIVIGDGVQTWGQLLRDVEQGELKPRYEATYERPYDLDPPPRRELLPRESFLTTAQSVRLLLSVHGGVADALSGSADRGRAPAVRRDRAALRGVHRQQPGLEA